MPIFEYRCKECGNEFEELVTGDREKVIACPDCGKNTEKLMSVIGGIAMNKNSGPSCASSCAGASACAASGGCPHAM